MRFFVFRQSDNHSLKDKLNKAVSENLAPSGTTSKATEQLVKTVAIVGIAVFLVWGSRYAFPCPCLEHTGV